METIKILNIDILSLTQKELLERLDKGVVITPNVDHLVKLQRDREFYEIYQQAEWVVCDSKILYLLSKLLKHPLPEAIPGSSFSRLIICTTRMTQIARFSCLAQWME